MKGVLGRNISHSKKVMKNYFLIYIAGLLLLCACANTSKEYKEQAYLQKGDSIVSTANSVLSAQVSWAIDSFGTSEAVRFYHEQANPLMDSVSEKFSKTHIKRLSKNPYNGDNQIKSSLDSLAWLQMKKLVKDTVQTEPQFVVKERNYFNYYRPIKASSSDCLQCHGAEKDLNPETRKKLKELYPQGENEGFKKDDLMGLWKITFDE